MKISPTGQQLLFSQFQASMLHPALQVYSERDRFKFENLLLNLQQINQNMLH